MSDSDDSRAAFAAPGYKASNFGGAYVQRRNQAVAGYCLFSVVFHFYPSLFFLIGS